MNLRISIFCLALALITNHTFAQNRPGGGRWAERERAGLAQKYKGITTDGKVLPNLFPIEKTGVDTRPMADAANKFIESLSDIQYLKTSFPVDSDEWRKWGNVHSYQRQGISFEELNSKQRDLAFEMIKASLSQKGSSLAMDIMKLNGTLGELTGRHSEYSEWMYYITIMGEPSTSSAWGWQLEGHHCIFNVFVLGDQVVMSPVFVGSEPVHATSGEFKGTIILQEEQTKALELISSLSTSQKNKAIIQTEKTRNQNRLEMFKDNEVVPYAGIRGTDLNAKQKSLLLNLVETFVSNLRNGHAKVKMNEVKKYIKDTHFAWVGGTGEKDVFYFRIHSPVVIIEFDHQSPIALGRRGSAPTRNHIHAVLRTPNGNDYGKSILAQHLQSKHKN